MARVQGTRLNEARGQLQALGQRRVPLPPAAVRVLHAALMAVGHTSAEVSETGAVTPNTPSWESVRKVRLLYRSATLSLTHKRAATGTLTL